MAATKMRSILSPCSTPALRNNRIYDADDWCVYVKGGSAYMHGGRRRDFLIAAQVGLRLVRALALSTWSPWLHYEAYAVRAVNNLIHDTAGAGVGVNGGYAVSLRLQHLVSRGHPQPSAGGRARRSFVRRRRCPLPRPTMLSVAGGL
jgi:hypothetical protein